MFTIEDDHLSALSFVDVSPCSSAALTGSGGQSVTVKPTKSRGCRDRSRSTRCKVPEAGEDDVSSEPQCDALPPMRHLKLPSAVNELKPAFRFMKRFVEAAAEAKTQWFQRKPFQKAEHHPPAEAFRWTDPCPCTVTDSVHPPCMCVLRARLQTLNPGLSWV